MQTITNIAAADQHAAYFAAVANAERRAMHSYFDQHVVEDDGWGSSPSTRATTARSDRR
jgi:hypothetical protein